MNFTIEEESEIILEQLCSEFSQYFDPSERMYFMRGLYLMRGFFLQKLHEQRKEANV